MPFPELPDWPATSRTLHQAAMLFGPIHNALLPPRKNHLHLPTFVEPNGLVSQRLPQGGRFHLDFVEAAVRYRTAAGETQRFALSEHTQASLFDALLTALEPHEGAGFPRNVPERDRVAGMLAKLRGDAGRSEFLDLSDVSGDAPLRVDDATTRGYAAVQYQVYTAVARFRARLEGAMTPVVVWPEHFDLSTLWFPPGNAAMDEGGPHINVGFAPYTPEQYELPYLYAYAHPFPEPFEPPPLPEPAFWHREGWRGVVVRYADLARQDDPAWFVESLLERIFEVLRKLL